MLLAAQLRLPAHMRQAPNFVLPPMSLLLMFEAVRGFARPLPRVVLMPRAGAMRVAARMHV